MSEAQAPLQGPRLAPVLQEAAVWLASLIFYTLLTIVLTWPVASRPHTLVAGGYGDPLLNVALIDQACQRLRHLSTLPWSEGTFFWPTPGANRLQDCLIAPALVGLPAYHGPDDAVLAYNLSLGIAMVSSALAAQLLVRSLTGSPAAGLVAGSLFAFFPYRFSQLGHLQLLHTAGLPLALLASHALVGDLGFPVRRLRLTQRGPSLRLCHSGLQRAAWALLLGLSLVYTALSSAYLGVYLGLTLLGFWLFHLRSHPRASLWALAAALGALLVVLPVYGPAALGVESELTRHRDIVHDTSPRPEAYVRAFPDSWLYGTVLRPALEGPWGEDRLFPGLVAPLLAALGLLLRRRSSAPTESWETPDTAGSSQTAGAAGASQSGRTSEPSRPAETSHTSTTPCENSATSPPAFYLGLLPVCLMLSLGPYLRLGAHELWLPYSALHVAVPGFARLRFPGRISLVGGLALAVLAGYGLNALQQRLSPRWHKPLVGLLLALVTLEALHTPLKGCELPTRQTLAPVYCQLALLSPGPVLELPLSSPEPDSDTAYMVAAMWYKKPLVNGYAAYRPAAYEMLAEGLRRWNQPRWSQTVRRTRARYVVLHEAPYPPEVAARLAQSLIKEAGYRKHGLFKGDWLLEAPPERP